ncbi:MAG: tetratricopeptide repeat protein [Chloroflexi bacterium]|nr:tetratricopeptide repeat protein [Chloroflexota bacterium]
MNLRSGLFFSLLIMSIISVPQNAPSLYVNFGVIGLVKASSHIDQDAVTSSSGDMQRWFDTALSLSPSDSRATRGKIITDWKAGYLEEARRSLAGYVAMSPNDKSAQLFLGDINYELGNKDLAIQLWRSLRAKALFVGRAKRHLASGELELAAIEMDVARLSEPDWYSSTANALLADQYADLVRIYEQKDKPVERALNCEKARETYAMALEGAPSDGVLRIHFGTLLRDCDQLDDAMNQFAVIDTHYSTQVRAWASIEIGLTYQQRNDLLAALPYSEQAVALDSDNGGHRILLGDLYARLGRTAEALAQFLPVTRMENLAWRSWAYAEMGAVHYKSNNLASAQWAYERALLNAPTRDDYRIFLGQVVLKMGYPEKARSYFIEASQSNNATWRAWAQQALSQLSQ